MRLLSLFIAGLLALILSPSNINAQNKSSTSGAGDRYFQFSNELFEDLQDDGFLRETRQGGRVVSAVLDVCYAASADTGRKDRFVVTLKPDGGKLVGKTQSQEDKVAVSVSLVRKVTAKTFAFEGTITIGTAENKISVTDKTDLGEAEFNEDAPAADAVEPQPTDFTEVSPGLVGAQVKRASFAALVKGLRDQNVKVDLDALVANCAELRSGTQTLQVSVEPQRAPALIAKLKSTPGVVAAGYVTGTYTMDNAIRLAAADWSSNGKLDREKFASAVGASAAKILSAKVDSSAWDAATGELTVKLKRPSALVPGVDLTETVEFTVLVGPEKPGAGANLIAWVGNTDIDVKDEGAGPRLEVLQPSAREADVGSGKMSSSPFSKPSKMRSAADSGEAFGISNPRFISVSTGPRTTAWTVTPCPAKSALSDCVMLNAAAFEIE